MPASELSPRQLRQLARLDRRVALGRTRFAVLGLKAGALGGIGWTIFMYCFAPGFGRQGPLPPAGDEAHALLQQVTSGLAQLFGPLLAIGLVATVLFGVGFAFFAWSRAWPLLLGQQAMLLRRAIASGQVAARPAASPRTATTPR